MLQNGIKAYFLRGVMASYEFFSAQYSCFGAFESQVLPLNQQPSHNIKDNND